MEHALRSALQIHHETGHAHADRLNVCRVNVGGGTVGYGGPTVRYRQAVPAPRYSGPVTGAKTARVFYGCNGWVAHHNLDLWRGTAPVDAAKFSGTVVVEIPNIARRFDWPMTR